MKPSAKISLPPGNMLNPLPVVMVSCGSIPDDYNIITVAWCGTICSEPPMCYVSIRRERHSYDLVKKYKEFVINLCTQELCAITDWCGVRSGRKYNKFQLMNITAMAAEKVKAPLIAESPLNIECIVKEIISLGSHDMFIAEVVAVHADEKLLDQKHKRSDLIRLIWCLIVMGIIIAWEKKSVSSDSPCKENIKKK